MKLQYCLASEKYNQSEIANGIIDVAPGSFRRVPTKLRHVSQESNFTKNCLASNIEKGA